MGKVHKGATSSHFTKIPNALIRNSEVNDGAFRLICWINSHTDGFSVSFASVSSSLGYGREKIQAIISNAEQNDYLVRLRTHDKQTGQFDWDYYVFVDPSDAIAFREEHDIPKPDPKPKRIRSKEPSSKSPSTVLPSTVNPSTGEPSTGEPVDGLTPPHKKTNSKKINSKKINKEEEQKEQDKSAPPKPKSIKELRKEVEAKRAAAQAQQVEVTSVNSSPSEVVTQPDEVSTLVIRDRSNRLNENDNHVAPRSQGVKYREIWEKTGAIPKIPVELNEWAKVDLGVEVMRAYRKSGSIISTSQNDIEPSFVLYVASTWKGKDIDYGYREIIRLEKDPTQWQVLRSLVLKWQASQSMGERTNVSEVYRSEVTKNQGYEHLTATRLF
jgi:hypothetical protein